ncbi:MAG: hypothetical protein ACQES2_08615 [Pseudomonadota bacterium]
MKFLASQCSVVMLLCLALVPLPLLSAEGERVLSRDSWERPRSASMVSQLPAVRSAVATWSEAPRTRRIHLNYPGGESGNLWALELRDWLVALGIPGEAIVLNSGVSDANQLAIQVERGVSP